MWVIVQVVVGLYVIGCLLALMVGTSLSRFPGGDELFAMIVFWPIILVVYIVRNLISGTRKLM